MPRRDTSEGTEESGSICPGSMTAWLDKNCPGPVEVSAEFKRGVYMEDKDPEKFPPPYFLNPFKMKNVGIMMAYFSIGVAIYILTTPVAYYLVDYLDTSSTAYSAYATLISLPWSFKFAFGMITDGNPMFNGYRRKSWLFIGWSLYVLFLFILFLLETPSFGYVLAFMFLSTCAYLQADVCIDCLCVERARFESGSIKGTLQTSGYTIRAWGCVLGALLGAILYNTDTWGWGLTIAQFFALSAVIPILFYFPVMWPLHELKSSTKAPLFWEQVQSIWDTLCLKAVWLPISFIFGYYVFQIPNQAWTNFLIEGLDFSDFEIGMLTFASAIFYWIGLILFKELYFDTGWQWVYIYTTIIGGVFSFLQVLLVLRVNQDLGIPDFWFALGDYSITTLLYSIQSMPSSIIFVMLCPDGAEGVTYALLTTIGNLGYTVACDIGSAFTLIWSVDNDTLSSGDFSGMLKLTLLTSSLQVFPIFFVWILPNTKEEIHKLISAKIVDRVAGKWLLITIVSSLVITIVANIVLIYY